MIKHKDYIANVIEQAAYVFGTTPKDIIGDGRFYHIAKARHAACFILSEHHKLDRSAVGRILNRNRNTIRASHNRAKYLMLTDPTFEKGINYIINFLI